MTVTEQLQELPQKPGVYLFRDETNTVLYVGKAVNLKNRVRSYFSDAHSDRPWIKVMIGLIKDIETISVTNELEALMLEATLIKQYLPKYNIKLTDDKAYPYIKLSRNEPIPRFSITRRVQTKTDGYYFGPYLSARSAQHALEFLRDLYGIHISDKPLRVNQDRACFNCQLSGHPCPQHNEISPEAYQEKIDAAVRFLQGKRKSLVHDLEKEMERASINQQYERAAKLRDRLNAAHQVVTNQDVISTTLDDYDALGITEANQVFSLTLLRVREGRVNNHFHFFFNGSEIEGEKSDVVRHFLTTLYPNLGLIPGIIALPTAITDQQLLETWFAELSNRKVELRVSERGDKKQMVELATHNAELKLQSRLVRSDRAFEGLIVLRELLSLEDIPERIEAVDISNLGSSEPVGATVCFINGQPDKNEYRRYIIKTVKGQNDFAMIREVVSRRLLDHDRPLPDLLVIDGGPEQLAFAFEAVKNADQRPKNIISLAKKPDRIFLPGRKSPVPASRGNKGLLLLSRIRDEVHRFGITFQRSRQKKKSLKRRAQD